MQYADLSSGTTTTKPDPTMIMVGSDDSSDCGDYLVEFVVFETDKEPVEDREPNQYPAPWPQPKPLNNRKRPGQKPGTYG